MNYPHLFSPIRINSLLLKNRIVMTAMHLGYTPGGAVTDRLVEFYALRARGGQVSSLWAAAPLIPGPAWPT